MTPISLVSTAATVLTYAFIVYYGLYNLTYLLILIRAGVEISREVLWPTSTNLAETFANPLTPGISVVVPAHNEEAGIVDAVHALLDLRYPLVRIIVVDDGSTDRTFERLQEEFGLRRCATALPSAPLHEGEITEQWETASKDLTVLRKKSVGRRADAVNAGLRAADQDLVCMIDADSILERDALLHVASAFIADPRVIGAGGVVRPANGVSVSRGAVSRIRMPAGWLERIQVLEYLRAFLIGRTGWSSVNGLLIISGAFGLFRRDAVLEVGGLDTHSLAEDADLVVALTKAARDAGRSYRMAFVAEPVCWTETPRTMKVLAMQRRRWSQGLGELLGKYRRMILNPRYGVLGMVTLPYFLLFEYVGPVFGAAGFLLALASTLVGLIPGTLFVLALFFSLGLSLIMSLLAVLIEENAYHRYSRLRDVLVLLVTTVVEMLGFHLVHSLWRLQGLYRATFRRPSEWGQMQRTGFQQVE
jgi:cellulose synthase/poly-beta-1,6-N-acetylglucosamine synthase-like glycosyltransferase